MASPARRIGSLSYRWRDSLGIIPRGDPAAGGVRLQVSAHRSVGGPTGSGRTGMTTRCEQIADRPTSLAVPQGVLSRTHVGRADRQARTARSRTVPASSVVVRRGTSTPTDGALPRRFGSDTLCAAAIRVFEDAFRQVPEFDPDMGVGQSYAFGRFVLSTRQRARAWVVPGATAAAAQQLFERVLSRCSNDPIAVIDGFPREFLAVVDRRTRCTPRSRRARRRWSDRLTEPVPPIRPSMDGR